MTEITAKPHPLQAVFDLAIEQVTAGKGEERHGLGADFYDQPWISLARTHGRGFLTGQAEKKLREAQSFTDPDKWEREMLGSIVYAGMAVLYERLKRTAKVPASRATEQERVALGVDRPGLVAAAWLSAVEPPPRLIGYGPWALFRAGETPMPAPSQPIAVVYMGGLMALTTAANVDWPAVYSYALGDANSDTGRDTDSTPQAKTNSNGHLLYDGTEDAVPGAICDRNGDVALSMCKICGRAEAELELPCFPSEPLLGFGPWNRLGSDAPTPGPGDQVAVHFKTGGVRVLAVRVVSWKHVANYALRLHSSDTK